MGFYRVKRSVLSTVGHCVGHTGHCSSVATWKPTLGCNALSRRLPAPTPEECTTLASPSSKPPSSSAHVTADRYPALCLHTPTHHRRPQRTEQPVRAGISIDLILGDGAVHAEGLAPAAQ